MKPFRRIVLFASAGVLTLAGCAPLIAPESRTTNYACADGKGFRLLSAGDAATIEIDGRRSKALRVRRITVAACSG
jgi:hypothetical protein